VYVQIYSVLTRYRTDDMTTAFWFLALVVVFFFTICGFAYECCSIFYIRLPYCGIRDISWRILESYERGDCAVHETSGGKF